MKKELFRFIQNFLNEKIIYLKKLIHDLRKSNNDTKSGMGDKYETSREMIQQEITHIQKQLNEVVTQKEIFSKIRYTENNNINIGSFVKTSMGKFCIACSLGEINFLEEKIFVISPQTPLAKCILGKKEGNSFDINNQTFFIIEVK